MKNPYYIYDQPIDVMVKSFANDPGNRDSIVVRIKPNSKILFLMSPYLTHSILSAGQG